MFLACSGLQLGCQPNDEGADARSSQGGDPGGIGRTGQPITWRPCPVFTGGDGAEAECAEVEVPLEWSAPEGDKIKLFVKRLPGKGQNRRQVWMLAGGPGGSGVTLEPFAEKLWKEDPSVDVYVPDHRGTGRSAGLDCPDAPSFGNLDPWKKCIASLQAMYGDKLAAFNTTNAARDVGALIERTRAPGQEVQVYGVSYGTLWAQRYLQVFPEQPTGVTLDSMCQSGLCSFFQLDYWTNETGLALMKMCAGDALCAGKLGGDPTKALGRFLDGLASGSCPELVALGIDRDQVRSLLALLVTKFDLRALIPALVYRGQRCAPGDVAAWRHLISALSSSQPAPSPLSGSIALGMNIGLSEMPEIDPPSVDEIDARDRSLYFSDGQSMQLRRLYDLWPRYARDRYVGQYPSTDVPMLLLNGTLDPETPIDFARQIAPHYDRPHQTLVVIPQGTHAAALAGSKLASDPNRMCGWEVWKRFMANPDTPVDASCVNDVQQVTFKGTPALAQALLGTDDLWEDGASARREPPGATDPEIREELEELDRRVKSGVRSVP